MELHPILEARCSPNPSLWYCISAFGDHPSERVGHTCTYIPGPDGCDGKVYVIGGANPNGPFAEVYVLELATFSWDTIECPGFKARYEHAAFVPKSKPHMIYIFGGAAQSGNFNDLQMLDTRDNTWSSIVELSGNPPSQRTYHITASFEDKFIVYSGGQAGSDPVGDRQVHCFDASTHAWTTLNVKGDPPKPRHGHVIVGAENKIVIHGGMSGSTFYDDLHILDLKRNTWSHSKTKKGAPCARAAHSGCYHNGCVYVFGGMSKEGALDDLYQLHLGSMKWSRVDGSGGPPPACRLDFGLCAIRLRVPDVSSAADACTEEEGTSDGEQLMVTGAMAKDVIDEQLRMGSAGSVRSMSSSAGSQRSDPIAALNATELPATTPVEKPTMKEIEGPSKIVDLCLVLGGMDTEGEIFDDCLVYMLGQEAGGGEGATGGAAANV